MHKFKIKYNTKEDPDNFLYALDFGDGTGMFDIIGGGTEENATVFESSTQWIKTDTLMIAKQQINKSAGYVVVNDIVAEIIVETEEQKIERWKEWEDA